MLLDLEGEAPGSVDVAGIAGRLAAIRSSRRLRLLGRHEIAFDPETDVVFSDAISPDGSEPFHVNNVRFVARDDDDAELAARSYLSVGGGRGRGGVRG